ncbi:BrnT family toxin [Gandjariella thermophila]|uniref:BrnT family toxin n=1 Tax=Gandjariella thermophila TaxID=1931992 RepID=UPI0010F584CC|nr:BrnT family toxin [Gandjariella thermophila]
MREIRWTDELDEHIWVRHGVTPGEVEQVLYTRPRWVATGRDGTTYVYGRRDAGRFLLVVLSEAQTNDYYVVTARDMTDGERRTYRRKAR